MQKKVSVLLVIPILIAFFSIGFISGVGESCSIVARGSCADNIVMGVSGLTNAHGEKATDGTYPSVLCCDFGTGKIDCVDEDLNGLSENKIIGLSSVTNAHAEIPSFNNYDVDVCYEDLVCTNLDTSVEGNCNDATLGTYPIDILSLSASTNAHIGNIADYPIISICCKSEAFYEYPCELTSAYWSLDGTTAIVTGDTANTGQEVYLIVEGTNCGGEEISFIVTEGGASSKGDASVQPVEVTFGAINALGNWTAEWVDDGLFGGDPEYYFVATVVSDPSEKIESPDPPLLEVEEQSIEESCLEQGISSCGDYNENDCNIDACRVASSDQLCDSSTSSCGCGWDAVEGCNLVLEYAGECGDDFIGAGEQCENDADITLDCMDFGFTGGDLSCNNCMIDTDGCDGGTEGSCGDGTVNIGEQCESGTVGFSCTDFDDFEGDGLICVDCMIDTSGCGGGEIGGACQYSQTRTNECDADPVGLFSYSWTGIWDGIANGDAWEECLAGGGGTFECPAQVQLPFFNFYNVIITLILIGLIYISLIFIRKKK